MTDLLGQAIHVPHQASNGYRETGVFGTPSHEAYSVAFKETLACPRILREGNPHSKVSPCSPEMVVRPGESPEGSTSTPVTARPSALYRRLKRRLGRTLRGLHGKRPLVQVRRRIAHKFVRTQGSPVSPKTVRAVVLEPDHSGLHGQHDSGCIHQQERGYEVRHLRARHIPGHLNVIADKLSRHRQIIQTEWALLQEVFNLLCRKWHKREIDLFATRFNHKLPKFVSPVPDRLAWAVDALSLQWKDLDAYAFPPTALLGQVVAKLLDHGCRRLILIAPGWPNMPWFWDLVDLSVQVPLSLPQVENLLTQPFNQCPHRNLFNLNLHAWLLEPRPSSRPVSLSQWQQELRLLRDAQPEPSTSQSGPFLLDGARTIRWTSGLHL